MKSAPDINDTLRQDGPDAVRKRHDGAKRYRRTPNGHGKPAGWISRCPVPEIESLEQLQVMMFAPLKYIVPDLIVEGCVLLAGKPKAKKSWLALDVGIAVAAGRYCLGDRKCEQGGVLYIDLESGKRRLQRRVTKLLGVNQDLWPAKFQYAHKWPKADQGGVEQIESWCDRTPDARLVIIDVLAKFRVPARGKAVYQEDYEALSKLQELATRRSITIIVVHHTRKGQSEDPVEEISGTLGLAAAADAFLVLKGTGVGMTLVGRGRDTEDAELVVEFDKDKCRWIIRGDASSVRRSDERGRILAALEEAGAEGLSPKDAADDAGLKAASVRQALRRMAKEGEVKKRGYGRYFHNSVTPVTLSHSAKKRQSPKRLHRKSDRVTRVTEFQETG